MGLLQLFNLSDLKRLAVSDQVGGSNTSLQLQPFVQGDAPSIVYKLMTYNGPSRAPTIVPVGSYSLVIGIYTQAGTQLAEQNTWTDDTTNNTKAGRLIQNSGNFSTALGSSFQVGSNGNESQIRFQAKITGTDGYDDTVLDLGCVIQKKLIGSVSTTVPVGQTAETVEHAGATYLPKVGIDLAIWNIRDSSGNITGSVRMYFDSDGTLQTQATPAVP